MSDNEELDRLEQRAEKGARSAAALAAAKAIIEEKEEATIRRTLPSHEGGNMSHDDYVRFTERLATLRRLRSDLEHDRDDGERARAAMTGDQS